MNGLRREQTDPRSIQLNQGITESALDELLYRPRFPAALLDGPTVGNVGPAACRVYAKAAGTVNGRTDILAPQGGIWLKGNISIGVVWSGTVASTITNVQWAISVSVSALGQVPANLGTWSFAAAGPATINGLLYTEFPNSSGAAAIPWPVDASTVLVGVNIGRQAGIVTDTYLGDVNVFGFRVIYMPSAGH